jgi:fructose-1,6-bisphosphatase II / sedoheptulose-1,7-bisphosphatase
VIDLSRSPTENIRAIAAAKGVDPSDIIACVLDRPRHRS